MSEQPLVRQHPPTNAPRPKMALEVARSIAACKTAARWADTGMNFGKSDALKTVVEKLDSSSVGTHQKLVAEALNEKMLELCEHQTAKAETRFAAILGAEPQNLRDDVSQLRELRRAGWNINSIPHLTLKEHADDPAVVALNQLNLAVEKWEKVKNGKFLGALERSINRVEETRPLVEVIKTLTLSGWDGELLAWAHITFETHNHIRLIWHQANKLARNFPDRHASDLFTFGWMGLRVALRAYDPERCAFSTYACTRIKGAIRDGVRAETPIPKRLTTYMRKVAKAEESLTQKLGRAPQLAEVGELMGEELEKLKIIPRLAPTASIDEMSSVNGRGSLDALIETNDPGAVVVDTARKDAVEKALQVLDCEDATAVRLLLLEGYTVAEAKRETGSTARQLRQRLARAKELLAVELEEWALV